MEYTVENRRTRWGSRPRSTSSVSLLQVAFAVVAAASPSHSFSSCWADFLQVVLFLGCGHTAFPRISLAVIVPSCLCQSLLYLPDRLLGSSPSVISIPNGKFMETLKVLCFLTNIVWFRSFPKRVTLKSYCNKAVSGDFILFYVYYSVFVLFGGCGQNFNLPWTQIFYLKIMRKM